MRFIVIFLSLFALFCGCEKKESLTSFSGQAMTMNYRVSIAYDLNTSQNKDVERIIADTFSYIDNVFNKWNPNSELSLLNQAKANVKIPLSKELEKHLAEISFFYKLTKGLFDPTAQTELAPAIGWDKIHVTGGLFWKDNDQSKIDLGGIAKGLAIDIIVDKLNSAGFFDLYVEWGGEIRASGKHPENRPWQVLIKGGNQVVELDMRAVATSGNYYQNWKIGDSTYTHIINPIKKRSLEITPQSISSVTIKAKSCMFADVLATASMLYPTKEKAETWLTELKEQYPDIEFWVF